MLGLWEKIMSILKDLKKKQQVRTDCVLKGGIVLLFNTQEQFNQLAELSGQYQEDSIIIEGDFVAYSDEIGAIQVEPLSSLCDEENVLEFIKTHMGVPKDFDVWYKKFK